MTDPIAFDPIYQERVWGGRKLESIPGRTLPADGGPFGESWEVVDRPEACSRVRGGPHDGRTLREIIASDPRSCMGPGWDPARRFPILVKWLDCRERLSLQVHPPATVARELGGEPKTENWYIAQADPGAAVLAGIASGTTREAFEAALREDRLEPLVPRLPTRAGDSLFVPSGRLHAIGAGNFILEIQQNSDTTYRVYDWGRVGLDGNPRELHIPESMRSIDFSDTEPELLHTAESEGEVLLANSPEFRLRRIMLAHGDLLEFSAEKEPRLIHLVSGRISAGDRPFYWGATLLLPFACGGTFRAEEPSVLLITDRFHHSYGG